MVLSWLLHNKISWTICWLNLFLLNDESKDSMVLFLICPYVLCILLEPCSAAVAVMYTLGVERNF